MSKTPLCTWIFAFVLVICSMLYMKYGLHQDVKCRHFANPMALSLTFIVWQLSLPKPGVLWTGLN